MATTHATEGPRLAARRSLHALALIFLLALLAGCKTNTEDKLAQQRLDVLKAEADSLEAMKKDLTGQGGANPALEGSGTVSIFLSKNLINSALKGVAGLTLPVPNVEGATLTIKSVSADLKLGYPLVTVDAEATKKDIGLTLQVVGTARLETKINSASPSQLIVNVRLEDLVPRAQWGIFDFKVRGFVQDLIKAKASEELSNLGTIQIPIATDIPLAVPTTQVPVSFPGAQAIVSAPALAVTGHVTISRILVLLDGLHVYGFVSARVGS
jgi:hypothetical protein